jgi:hypothetical protein
MSPLLEIVLILRKHFAHTSNHRQNCPPELVCATRPKPTGHTLLELKKNWRYNLSPLPRKTGNIKKNVSCQQIGIS